MRTIGTTLFASVDGVVSSPNLWQFDNFDPELGQLMGEALADIDTVLLGATTYREWSEWWPQAGSDDPFGGFINPVAKHVASHSLGDELVWNNSRRIQGDLIDHARELRAAPGAGISVCGSISVVRQLFFAGMLDELTLIVHPVVAGSGTRLFREGDPLTRLVQLESRATSSGNTIMRYTRRGE